MTTSELTLAAEFPSGSREQWLALVDTVLKGADFDRKLVSNTYDGIAIQPLYTRQDRPPAEQLPGQGDLTRGVGGPRGDLPWSIATIQRHPLVEEANRQVLTDLEGGANSLVLRLDVHGAGAVDGTVIGAADDLAAVLEGVYLDLISVTLEAGPLGATAAELLVALYDVKGVSPAERAGSLGLDPIGALAATGALPQGLDGAFAELRELANRVSDAPNLRTINVDTAAVVDAGASEVEELAVAIATALEYVRALCSDRPLEAAFGEIAFTLQSDADFFAGVAKLRAARRLWAHAVRAAGVDPVALATPFASRTATRMMSQRDPWVNMLRTTAACFAAGVGGASSVAVQPFDSAVGLSDDLARRIARNTQLILQEEANLGAVIDPAGGSNYIEALTTELVERSWARFQEIEAAGGMVAVLTSGAEAETLQLTREARLLNIARRRDPLTGVSEFPNIDEAPLTREQIDLVALRNAAVAHGVVPAGPATTIEALPAVRNGSEFEALRDASDALAATDERPSIFMANLGPVAAHTARATYAKNFFEAGGVKAVGDVGHDTADAAAEAFIASGLEVAVICGSDSLYAELAAPVATALKKAGARRVYLAGNPGDARGDYEAAGVDEFVYVGVNVLDTLTRLLKMQGALS